MMRNFFFSTIKLYWHDNMYYYISLFLLFVYFIYFNGSYTPLIVILFIPFLIVEYKYYILIIEKIINNINTKIFFLLFLPISSSFFYTITNKYLNIIIMGDPSYIFFTKALIIFILIFALFVIILLFVVVSPTFITFFRGDQSFSLFGTVVYTSRLLFFFIGFLFPLQLFLNNGQIITTRSLFYIDGNYVACSHREDNSVFIQSGKDTFTKIKKMDDNYTFSLHYCDKGDLIPLTSHKLTD